MIQRIAVLSLVMHVFVGFAISSLVAQEYDASVSPDYFLGTGNTNGGFTVSRGSGVELGLRAKLRFNESDSNRPANVFNSRGDGSYNFQSRNVAGEAGLPGWWVFPETPEWSFEFSINSDTSNTDSRPVGALTYMLSLDQDPSVETDFFSFDPINLPYADHYFGTSNTLDGTDETFAFDPVQYAQYLSSKTVAQQAWNYAFFLDYLPHFSSSSLGVYDIRLSAYEGGLEIASVGIRVLVGAEQFSGQDPKEIVSSELDSLISYDYLSPVKKGIDNALDSKLVNARDAYIGDRYDSRFDVVDRLDAYSSQLTAQQGKKVDAIDAEYLRAGAQYTQVLISILP